MQIVAVSWGWAVFPVLIALPYSVSSSGSSPVVTEVD
jgi:hypothetical protein